MTSPDKPRDLSSAYYFRPSFSIRCTEKSVNRFCGYVHGTYMHTHIDTQFSLSLFASPTLFLPFRHELLTLRFPVMMAVLEQVAGRGLNMPDCHGNWESQKHTRYSFINVLGLVYCSRSMDKCVLVRTKILNLSFRIVFIF